MTETEWDALRLSEPELVFGWLITKTCGCIKGWWKKYSSAYWGTHDKGAISRTSNKDARDQVASSRLAFRIYTGAALANVERASYRISRHSKT